jgi:sensor domain CHASE-containing protein
MDLAQIDQFIYNYSNYTPINYTKILFLVLIFIVILVVIIYFKHKNANSINTQLNQKTND